MGKTADLNFLSPYLERAVDELIPFIYYNEGRLKDSIKRVYFVPISRAAEKKAPWEGFRHKYYLDREYADKKPLDSRESIENVQQNWAKILKFEIKK